jgi:hypothetical protein
MHEKWVKGPEAWSDPPKPFRGSCERGVCSVLVASREAQVLYDSAYFDSIRRTSEASSGVVVPLVAELIGPQSVLDVGCGDGTWLTLMPSPTAELLPIICLAQRKRSAVRLEVSEALGDIVGS